MRNLKIGTNIPLTDGTSATIQEEIGTGGQGTVYKVSIKDEEYALKWYFRHKLHKYEQFRKNIEENIYKGCPSNDFLWPKTLTEEYDGTFGYIMNLRPQEYADFSDILNNRTKFSELKILINSAIQIVDAFRELHRKGYCYQDINDGNFFINVNNGNVLICDNDNVAPYGVNLGIAGKPGYMAPEIVRGVTKPNQETDAHSLAVVLFKLFLRHDPLMGKKYVAKVCITEKTEKELYGDNPIFIFDPDDDSNRPVPGVHPNPIKLWPYYPKYMQDIFIKAFAKGMKNPQERPTDNEWRDILIRLRSEVLTCTCGTEMLASCLKPDLQNGIFTCSHCHTKHIYPMVMQNGKHKIYLFPGNKLYTCHIDSSNDDCMTEVATVTRNKKNPSLYGIRNNSTINWICNYNGKSRTISNGDVIPVAENMKIAFGHCNQAIIKSDL